jgi:hypothetical protein
MGFSIKLAPGVRVRASSRGLRTSVGPRVARVHVGAGRTGFSTGAGPVSFYTSLSNGRRTSSGGRGRAPSTTAYQRELARQRRIDERNARLDQAKELLATFQHILELHREDFPPAVRPLAPAPQQPDQAAIYRHFEAHALKNVGRFKRAEREQARRQAAAWTDAEAARLWQEQVHGQAQAQGWLDQCWSQLCANVPDMVMETLTAAFEDNEVASAPIGVVGDEVALALLVPGIDGVVPERLPTTTQAGNISFRKIPKKDRVAYYSTFVCGQALVTVREAFAVAPGIRTARVVVLRAGGRDVYGQERVECLLAAAFDRAALEPVVWESAGAADILNETSRERLVQQTGPSKELTPLSLASEPELRAVVEAIDLRDLGVDAPAAAVPSGEPTLRRFDSGGGQQASNVPVPQTSPIEDGRGRAQRSRAEVDRIVASGRPKAQINEQLKTVIHPCLEATRDLTTSLGQRIVDSLRLQEDAAHAQRVLAHLNQATDLMSKSLDATGPRGPYELLAEIDAVLWALEGAWRAAGMQISAR